MRLPLPDTTDRPSTDRDRRVLSVAHRGASQDVAENTLASLRRAVAVDADMVEVDVQRTKDGALVVLHDTTLVRTTNARLVFPRRSPWRVSDFTFEELRRLDAGSWKSPDYAGEQIPSLTEVIELIGDSRAGLLLELKAPELYPGMVSDVVAAIRGIPGHVGSAVAAGRLVVQSFDFAAVKEFKTREPTVPVGLLGAPARANLPALATWADQVNPGHMSVDKAYVDEVHRSGMACLVWTVNHRSGMKRALRLGVDGVITNRPDVLARTLGRRVDVHA